eukprot:1433107-Rhodomonas_salina.1
MRENYGSTDAFVQDRKAAVTDSSGLRLKDVLPSALASRSVQEAIQDLRAGEVASTCRFVPAQP